MTYEDWEFLRGVIESYLADHPISGPSVRERFNEISPLKAQEVR